MPNPDWQPSGLMICSRCRLPIGFDARTSWWLDEETQNPACSIAEDGVFLAHDPINNPDLNLDA